MAHEVWKLGEKLKLFKSVYSNPDSLIIMAHGKYDGGVFNVPQGMALYFYCPHGSKLDINNTLGVADILGHVYENETIQPYETIVSSSFDYSLSAATKEAPDFIIEQQLKTFLNGKNFDVITILHNKDTYLNEVLNAININYKNKYHNIYCKFCRSISDTSPNFLAMKMPDPDY